MGKKNTGIKDSRAWIYCFKRGDKAVLLNRWDQAIKEFDTYKEAEDFANANNHLIDKKINKSK